tara:strand:+ start:1162 stop:1425 length:264 start_codon:yes stop_codon:yes gene_type:complete
MIYDYRCPDCKFEMEELVKKFDDPVCCKECGHPSMTRKFPAPAIKSLNSKEKISESLRKRSLADAKRRSEEYGENARRQVNTALGRK